MKILITGHNGFIGKNVVTFFSEIPEIEIYTFGSQSSLLELDDKINKIDFIFHLAGVNRPKDDNEFYEVNTNLTKLICETAKATGRIIPIIFTSSIHVKKNNIYGESKLAAENFILEYSAATNAPIFIYRLPHVIGKWCKPNYNSVVATFCYNISHNLPISIDDPDFQLDIVYIDDLLNSFKNNLYGQLSSQDGYCKIDFSYKTTVGELAKQLYAFKNSRINLINENVGTGLIRALYSTYISYLPVNEFSYSINKHQDSRGIFVEVLKTKNAGQFSFFTAHPGVTRGGHYHNTKTEKFIVIKGVALFRFENIINGEYFELIINSDDAKIVETIPGWTHDITNIGDEDIVVMLWANEIFNRDEPDTYFRKINSI